jgi:hypothetical protein
VRAAIICLLFVSYITEAQVPVGEEELLGRLKPGTVLPGKLLSSRSIVFYPYTMGMKELETIQKVLQRTGVDAVAYLESDLLAAGRDASVTLAEYLNTREITNLLIFQKSSGYNLYIAEYNNKANLFEVDQNAWFSKEKTLDVLLQRLYLLATNTLKKENMLINDVPELAMPLNPFKGQRSEFFAIDLKVDPLAVPKFGDEAMDKELEEIMKSYPYKYTLTEPHLSEAEIRKGGAYYVLRYFFGRDKVAQDVLGYDMTKSQNAIVSVTYPEEKQQLKNIPANTIVYKFYFKHIDSGNVFLGTKWDADLTWQQALINQIKAFKAELRIN